jgi:hypothetical protein
MAFVFILHPRCRWLDFTFTIACACRYSLKQSLSDRKQKANRYFVFCAMLAVLPFICWHACWVVTPTLNGGGVIFVKLLLDPNSAISNTSCSQKANLLWPSAWGELNTLLCQCPQSGSFFSIIPLPVEDLVVAYQSIRSVDTPVLAL